MIDESKYDHVWQLDPERLYIRYGGEKMTFDRYIEIKIEEHDK